MLNFLGQLIATLFGAFAGAYGAYWFAQKKDAAEERKRRAAAVNLATLAIWQIIGSTRRYKENVLDDAGTGPDLWWQLMPSTVHPGELIEIDYAGLQFLNDTKEPRVLTDVVALVSNFSALRDSVERQSTIHMDELQVSLAKSGHVPPFTSDQVEHLVGPRVTASLKAHAESISELVEGILESANKAHGSMIRLAKPFVGKHALPFIMPNLVGMKLEAAVKLLKESFGQPQSMNPTDKGSKRE